MSEDRNNDLGEWYAAHEEGINHLIEYVLGGQPANMAVELKLVEGMPSDAFLNGDLITGMVLGLTATARGLLDPANALAYRDCGDPECESVHPIIDGNSHAHHLVEVSKALLDLHTFHRGLA